MKAKIVVGVLVVLLIGSCAGLWFASGQIGRLKAGIAERNEVIQGKTEMIEGKNAEMIKYGAKIRELERQVASAQARIEEQERLIKERDAKIAEQTGRIKTLEDDATRDRTRIAERDAKITEKNTQLQELSDVIRRLEMKLGRSAGLIIPTYQELIDFVKMDLTNKHKYSIPGYQITDFAADLNNSAEKWGFRAGYVYVKFKSYQPWYLVVFQTTDRGMVYVNPTTDEVVSEPVVGGSFKLADWTKSYEVEKVMIVW